MALLCLSESIFSQNIITYGDIVNTTGNSYEVDVLYTNNSNNTFTPTSLYITINLQGPFSALSGTAPSNAGWTANPLNSNTIRFNTNVNGALWNSGIGETNTIGTIQFDMTTSGCISFQTISNSYLFSVPTLDFRPVSGAFTKCVATGNVTLATSNDNPRARAVVVSDGISFTIEPGGLVGGGNDDTYSLCNVPPGNSFYVLPSPVFNKLNGNVKTSDIVAITQHILGATPLTESYEMVAADVNIDEYIDVSDILAIQKAILGNAPTQAEAEAGIAASWFYPTDTSLSQINANTLVTYETEYGFSDINSNTSLDFTAVKSGDVAVDTNTVYDKTLDAKILEITDVALRGGEFTDVPVYMAEVNNMLAMSMALKFTKEAITIRGLKSGELTIDPSTDYVIDQEYGMLNMILINFNPDVRLDPSKPAFYLQVKANQSLKGINNLLEVTSDRVDAEFFGRSLNKSKKTTSVGLEITWAKPFEVPSNDFVTLTSANPFYNEVVVNITSEFNQVATFSLFDITGKHIFSGITELTKGNNTLNLEQKSFPTPTGTYFLNIRDESGRISTIKLIKK